MSALFTPIQLGDIHLANRIVMAPMTRSRATEDHVPTELMARYYAQRASAGLIVAEGTAPSAAGIGYCRTPGIYTSEQIAGWRRITDAVHEKGGKIVLQLMHVGRVSSHFNKPEGAETLCPSPTTADVQIHTDQHGVVPTDTPREMTEEDIVQVIEEYARAARDAISAGFDGVELHCTSGYLPMQFMASGVNSRTDQYGGSLENRVRFPAEVLEALCNAIGAARVGYRMRPGNAFNDTQDDDPIATTVALVKRASQLSLAYLHMMNPHIDGLDVFALAREHAGCPIIMNDGFDADTAARAVDAGVGDAVSFGRSFIANPDLVMRIRNGWPLEGFNKSTVYTPGEAGYTDYCEFDPASAESSL